MVIEESVPASFASRAERLTQRQLLFWLGQKRCPELPLYNMVIEVSFAGALDVQRFRRAFAELFRASDALRSAFGEFDGIARRVVLPSDGYELPFVDLSGSRDPMREYEERTQQASAQAFDLGRRCFDSRLFQLGEGRFVWWFCQHHIIGDGVSVGLMLRFLAARYADEKAPALASAAEAEAQETAYRNSPRATEDEIFWAPRRKRILERASFYGLPAQPELGRRHVERLEVQLDDRESARVRELAQAHGPGALPDLAIAAWFQTVLVAYLERVTGRAQQALGIPFRNRHGVKARRALGCFIEVLPVQVEVARSDTFVTLFHKVFADTVAALPRGQACVANSESSPLFEVSFNFLTERYPPFPGLDHHVRFSTGLHALPGATRNGESLTVHCQDYLGSGRYTLWLDFNAAYFDAQQRERAVAHFMKLFRASLSRPEARVMDVEIVDSVERFELLDRANPAWEPECADETLVSMFEARAAEHAERVAVRFHELALSYAALNRRATRVASALARLGVERDTLVAVLLTRSLDVPCALLGIVKAGGAYVPLDPTHPRARNQLVLEDARPRVVLTERQLAGELAVPSDTSVLYVDDLETSSVPVPGELPHPRPEDLAYVLFTSGSTGRPKGVAVPHGALANFLRGMQAAPGISASDRLLALTTIAFDISALELFLPLVSGAEVELVDSLSAADPHLLIKLLAERRPSILQATPATYRMLLDTGWRGDSNLKALCGGEALAPALAARLAPRVRELWNLYGPTETTVWSSLDRVDPARPTEITVGRPIRNTSIYIVNESLALAPIGVPGEICIGGAGVARGYYANEALTSRSFVADPFSERAGARLYRTGDLGRRLPDGRIEHLGRADSQLKIRGFRIELGEIEGVLGTHPEVDVAVVVAHAHSGEDKELAAYILPRGATKLDVGELRGFVKERLPAYMVPATFTLIDALPLTPNGKLDRKALPAPERISSGAHDPPRSDLELRIAALFEQLLGVPEVGRSDSFFDLGGQSLLAAQLLGKLNAIAKRPIGLGQVFAQPTVAELSELIRAGGTSDEPLLIPLNRTKAGLPLFCISGIHLYRELAANLPEQPVYGVYLPAEERALNRAHAHGEALSVEELAQGYLEVIRKHRPEGPYCLAGVSFGGVLAYEIAQALQRMGEQVPLLALFDSTLPRALKLRMGRWLREHARRAAEARSVEYITERALRVAELFFGRREEPRVVTSAFDRRFRVRVYADATRRYDASIRPYPGKILLFRASARDDFAGYEVERALGWEELASSLTLYEAEGDHLSILRAPGVGTLAEPIRSALAAWVAERS